VAQPGAPSLAGAYELERFREKIIAKYGDGII